MPITLGTLSSGEQTPFTLNLVRTGETTGVNSSSFTITNASVGTEAADRILIFCMAARGASGSSVASFTSLTVGGVSATKRIEQNAVVDTNYTASSAIYTIPWPTGTTANVAYALSSNRDAVSTSIYAGYGMSSEVPTTTDAFTYTSGTQTRNIPVSSGGQIIGMFTGQAAATTWGGITENYDAIITANASGGFSRSQTVSVSISNSFALDGVVAIAAFR